MGHAVSASVEAREKLAMKRQGMAHFHIGRLQRDGFMPLHPPEEFFDAIDPEDQARAAFDHPTIRSRNPYLGQTPPWPHRPKRTRKSELAQTTDTIDLTMVEAVESVGLASSHPSPAASPEALDPRLHDLEAP